MLGYSNWSDAAYHRVRQTRERASATEIFRDSQSVDPLMDPRRIQHREARDSEHHPRSTPIVVAFDVTASMGYIPTEFAKVQLGALMTKLVEQGWAVDPQLLFAAIGDAVSDRGPLQVGQFESGLEMDQWLTRIWLEGRGGDIPESYTLAHWFTLHRTRTDAWEQRGERGLLFTIGDAPNKPLKASHLARVFGGSPREHADTLPSLMADVLERWECWHILVPNEQGISPRARADWTQRLPNRVVECSTTSAICEVMGVLMGVSRGRLALADGLKVLRAVGLAEPELAGIERCLAS